MSIKLLRATEFGATDEIPTKIETSNQAGGKMIRMPDLGPLDPTAGHLQARSTQH